MVGAGWVATVVVVVELDVVVVTAAPLVQAAPSTARAMRQTTRRDRTVITSRRPERVEDSSGDHAVPGQPDRDADRRRWSGHGHLEHEDEVLGGCRRADGQGVDVKAGLGERERDWEPGDAARINFNTVLGCLGKLVEESWTGYEWKGLAVRAESDFCGSVAHAGFRTWPYDIPSRYHCRRHRP